MCRTNLMSLTVYMMQTQRRCCIGVRKYRVHSNSHCSSLLVPQKPFQAGKHTHPFVFNSWRRLAVYHLLVFTPLCHYTPPTKKATGDHDHELFATTPSTRLRGRQVRVRQSIVETIYSHPSLPSCPVIFFGKIWCTFQRRESYYSCALTNV